MRVFQFEGPLYRFLERAFDLVLLQLLWVICSLPVFTIGASTTALLTVTMRMARGEEGYVFKGFLKAFQENFKKSTLLFGLFFAAIAWCIFMILVSMGSGNAFLQILEIPEAAIVCILVAALQYVFAIQARYENRVWQTAKNAVTLSLRFLPYTLILLSVAVVPILITAYVPSIYGVMLSLWLFGGSSLIALADSYILIRVFDKLE